MTEDFDSRLATAERDLRDHSKTLTAHNEAISKLLDWKAGHDLIMAREDERDKSLYRRLDEIERRVEEVHRDGQAGVKEIKDAGSKLQWMVIGAVVLAFVGFVLRGGLGGL